MTADTEATSSIRYNPPQVMTIEEVAVYLGFAEATIRRMLRDREIPAAKVAGQWRFLASDVDRWLAGLSKQQTAPAGPEAAVSTFALRQLLEAAMARNDEEDEAVMEILIALSSLVREAEGSLESGQPTFEEALSVFRRPPAGQQEGEATADFLRRLHGPDAKLVSRENLNGLGQQLASGEVDRDEALTLLGGLPDIGEGDPMKGQRPHEYD